MEVVLHICEIGEIKKAILTRKGKFNKQQNEPFDSEVTLILKYTNGDERIISSKTNKGSVTRILKQLFPEEIAAFHLFDGEFLELTYTNKGGNIEAGIRNLFRIMNIEELSRQSKELGERYGKERKKYTDNNELQKKIEDLDKKTQERDSLLKKIVEFSKEIEKINSNIEDTKSKIESMGNIEVLKERFDRLKVLENSIKENERKRKDSIEHKNKIILKNAYKFIASDVYKEVSKSLGEYTEKGKIPPEIKDKFVSDLLRRGKCICGSDLSQENDFRRTVEKLLEEISGSSEKEVLLDLYYATGHTVEVIESLKSEIDAKDETIREINNRINEDNVSKRELMSELQEIDSFEAVIEKFNTLKANETRFEDTNKEYEFNKFLIENQLDVLDSDIRKLKQDIDRINERNSTYKKYNEYYARANLLTNIFNSIIKNIFTEIAARYEEKINELIKLIPILSKFEVKVSISETNKMTFKFLQAGDQRFYMAGGQNQLMGILLIAAFTKVLRKSAYWDWDISSPFVVIDNPVSTLSSENIALFGRVLGDLFEGVHLILFTKDSDYEKILEGASGNVTKFYWLSRGDISENTEIKEVI